MKKQLRILFTNNSLANRAGSELVIFDLATEFRRRGHMPVAYSSQHGKVAEALKKACIPVISDLNALGVKPDIIHGQHHIEAMTAMLHFPDVPAVYACHGWLPWQERPPQFCNIRKYIAVGELTRESIVTTCGVHQDDVTIISNFVDLSKFQIRTKFYNRPQSALIFDNTVAPNCGYAETVRLACAQAGIAKVDIIGKAAKNTVDTPHREIGKYDVVFAVGRSALEAMAVGCSVIIASPLGAYGMIDPQNVESMFGHFGLSSLDQSRLNASFLHSEILKHRPSNALDVAHWIREKIDLRLAADKYEAIYREAIGNWESISHNAEFSTRLFKDAAKYIASLKPLISQDRLKQEILLRHSLASQLRNRGIKFGSS